ncbi:MAG TPA: alkene reductase [Gammaproteobacteria bacterium]|jgi:N-ethylmaleimide reductase|nr:alkene reductase [Gammaproteobacteria bacterium]
MPDQPLLQPVTLGPYTLKNRIVMAPMTRSRANNPDRAPTNMHVTYYGQRASAGLIITEATQVSPQGVGYIHTPGLHSAAQVAAWRDVTTAVHAAGGTIFSQIFHVGRVSHPDFHNGELPVAPSAINPEAMSFTTKGRQQTVTPRALETAEIEGVVADFVQAAKNAVKAGFDGVELHGANGYLINQFLADGANQRDDRYGGSVANRSRFLFDILDGVTHAIGARRTALRLGPSGLGALPIADSNSRMLYEYVITRLNDYKLAYLHLIEPSYSVADIPNTVQNVTRHFRPFFDGVLVTNNGYDRERGNAVIAAGHADLVAYGKPFISNPDLPQRFRLNAPLAEGDAATFYQGGREGYIDYPPLRAEVA